jgi:hypothetical protein
VTDETGTPDGRALVALNGLNGTRVWLATDALMGVVALDPDFEAEDGSKGVDGSQIILRGGVGLQVLGDPDTVIGILSGTLDQNGYTRALGYGESDDGVST